MSDELFNWEGHERRCSPQQRIACPEAREVADQAVRKVFAILGVDIDVPKEVEEFREDLRFGKSMRQLAGKGIMAIIGVIASGLVLALWTGLTMKVGK